MTMDNLHDVCIYRWVILPFAAMATDFDDVMKKNVYLTKPFLQTTFYKLKNDRLFWSF